MEVFKLLLSGDQIEDVFVYRTSIYCWTFDQKLRVYSVADVEEAAMHSDQDRAPKATYGLFHSRGYGTTSIQRSEWRKDQSDTIASSPPIIVSADDVRYVQFDIGIEANGLLDMLMFYNKLYLGTDNGLFSVEPFDAANAKQSLQVKKRLFDPCYSTSGGLGAVAVSCGQRGLVLLLADHEWASHERKPRKVASESARAEVGYGTVVNHRSLSEYEFFAGEFSDEDEKHVLTGVENAKLALSAEVDSELFNLYSNMMSSELGIDQPDEADDDLTVDQSAVEFVIWDQSRLVFFAKNEVLSVSVITSKYERRLNRTRVLATYNADVGRIISASRVGKSFAVETEDSVVLVSELGSHQVDTGPVVSLRSYPNSYRYRRLLTATTAAGVWMIGVRASDSRPD